MILCYRFIHSFSIHLTNLFRVVGVLVSIPAALLMYIENVFWMVIYIGSFTFFRQFTRLLHKCIHTLAMQLLEWIQCLEYFNSNKVFKAFSKNLLEALEFKTQGRSYALQYSIPNIMCNSVLNIVYFLFMCKCFILVKNQVFNNELIHNSLYKHTSSMVYTVCITSDKHEKTLM